MKTHIRRPITSRSFCGSHSSMHPPGVPIHGSDTMVEIESRDKATCGDCVLLSVMFQRNPPKPRKIHPFAKKAKYTS